MPMPLRQSLRVGSYLMKQKLTRNKKFPLLVELEPLFACNLKCAGCGKIQQPHTILKQRMPVEQAIGAVEESGAPMVSIAGGEPLMHPQIDVIVSELIKRKKFVFLCTNALLLPKKLDKFKPSPYFSWVVHIDGLQGPARRVGLQGRRVRRGGGRDQAGQVARVHGEHEHHVLQHRHPADDHRRAQLPQRRPRRRPDADLARLRLREGARPGAFPRRGGNAGTVPQGVRATAGGRSGG